MGFNSAFKGLIHDVLKKVHLLTTGLKHQSSLEQGNYVLL
jgi:hypothetical protein